MGFRLLAMVLLTLFLAGCKSGGGSGASASGATAYYAAGEVGGGGIGGSGDEGGEINLLRSSNIPLAHNPEPSSLILLGIGLGGLAAKKFRNKKKKA